MDPTPAPANPPRTALDAADQLEQAVDRMAAARTALDELESQRRLITSSTLALLVALSVATFSLLATASAPWLATATMAAVVVLMRHTIQVDIDRDSRRRSELVEARMREVELKIAEADRALDPTGVDGGGT